MKLRTQAIGAALLLVVALALWGSKDSLPLPFTNPDTSEKRVFALIGKSSEPVIVVSVTVISSVRGQLVREFAADRDEPYHRIVTANPGEVFEISLAVSAIGPSEIGYKVFSRCEILMNGVRQRIDRQERRIVRLKDRDTHTACTYYG